MTTTALEKQRPPSPPASVSGEYQHDLQQLVQHNAATPYRNEQYVFDEGGYVHSGQSTTYGSPASNQWQVDQRDPYQQHENGGLGMNYGWYGNPLDSQNPPNPYHTRLHGGSVYAGQRFSAVSPPTPTASDLSGGEKRMTRSGRPLAPTSSDRSQKVAGSPKVKKAKQSKGDKPKIPKIDAPLSELTKDYKHIPVRNMEEWVNRSAEIRRKEVEKRNGYVTRPMNSFMLYRSAFAERTKLWCLQNNHQVVSSVSGESWPMEPPEVREQYNEYARIERDNHQKAHPGYKFSPSKAQNTARKRKGMVEDSDDEETSSHDDPDFDWRPPGERRSRTKVNKRLGREAGYPVNSTLNNQTSYAMQPPDQGLNRSSYQAINPGKPLPAQMTDFDMYGQYYQTTVHPSLNGPNVEDVRIRKMAMPGMQSGAAPPLIGLPGSHHYELLDHDGLRSHDQNLVEVQLDPSLLGYEQSYGNQHGGFLSEQQFNEYNEEALFGTTAHEYAPQRGAEAYHPEQNAWQFGENRVADADEEFAKWMEENNDR